MKSKHKALTKMITSIHYDRALGKLIRKQIPESSEHKERIRKMFSQGNSKELSHKEKIEYQHKVGRAYNE